MQQRDHPFIFKAWRTPRESSYLGALRRRQVEAFAGIDKLMSTGSQPPSVRAADIVLATMHKARRPG